MGPPDLLEGDWTARSLRRARSRGVLRDRRFLRLWLSQIVSNLGDWAYILAVQISFASTLGDDLVRATAIFLGVEGLTSAVVGLTIAGPIVDRFPRRAVMVTADIARCLAVGTLVLAHDPTWLHVIGVAAILGAFRSMFHPALMATVPDLVEGDAIVVANGLLTSTFHLAIMVGPALGAALVAAVGPSGAFVLNAASFALSAVLLIGLRTPAPPTSSTHERFSPLADLREGASFILSSRLARGIALAMGLSLLLLAGQSPFQVALVRQVLAPDGNQATWAIILGAMTTTIGVGMVLGSALTPWLSRRYAGRTLLVGALTIVAVSFAVVSRTALVPIVLIALCCNGLAGGCVNVTYETLLQVGTPARLRGRVFATVESASDGAYVLGAAIVAGLGATASPSTAFLAVGACFLLVALLAARAVPADASMRIQGPPAG